MPIFATYLYMSWYIVGVVLWCAFWVNSTDFDLIRIRADDNTGVFVRMLQLADVRLYVHGVAGRLTEKQLLLLASGDSSAELDPNYKCLETTSSLMKDQVCLLVYVCTQCDMCDTYAYVHSNMCVHASMYIHACWTCVWICMYTQIGVKLQISDCSNNYTHDSSVHIWFAWCCCYQLIWNSLEVLLEALFTRFTHRYGKMRMGMTVSGIRNPSKLSFCAKNKSCLSRFDALLILHCIADWMMLLSILNRKLSCSLTGSSVCSKSVCCNRPAYTPRITPGTVHKTPRMMTSSLYYHWMVAGNENPQVAYAT